MEQRRILYGYWRSSAAYRVRIALALKDLAYEPVAVDLRAGEQAAAEYIALNPQGLVPLLVDGAVTLSQSMAIVEYLDETYGGMRLLPENAAERAHVRAMAQVVACDVHPLNNLRVLKYLKNDLAQPQEAIDDWARHWIGAGFAVLEQSARKRGGEYLTGGAITLADLCLVPQLYNAERVETDLTPYPKLLDIAARLRDHPAFAAAHPDNFV